MAGLYEKPPSLQHSSYQSIETRSGLVSRGGRLGLKPSAERTAIGHVTTMTLKHYTLAPVEEQPASAHREWSEDRFDGREGEIYTVVGKGGLVREVCIPNDLAERLEAIRLDEPKTMLDRGIEYQTRYGIGGGNA